MPLIDEIKPFLHPTYGTCRGATLGDDNMPKDEAVLLLLLPEVEREKGRYVFYQFASQCEIYPGIFLDKPKSPNRISVDNLIGYAACSAIHGLDIADRIYHHGVTHNWVFDRFIPENDFVDELEPNPEKFLHDWMGRFQGFPPFVKAAAGRKLGFFTDQQAFGRAVNDSATDQEAILTSHPKDDVGNYILQWIENEIVYGKHWLTDSWIRFWRKKMQERYPGGLSELLSYYYKIPPELQSYLGSIHPFVKYAPKDFRRVLS